VGAADTTASRTSLDTRTVRALLADSRLSFRLLVGHSKGNLVLAAALHDLCGQDTRRAATLAERTKIVTIGTRIAMPPLFTDVVDVIGEWDWFGEMNSRSYLAPDRRVAHAWHHTNTELTGHLPVTATLRDILATAPVGEEARTASAPHVATETAIHADEIATHPTAAQPARPPLTIEKVKKAFSTKSLPDPYPAEGDTPSERRPPERH
ncbi:MAG: hypothetical protein QM636_10595, partial [Rhizobium sp.]